MVCVRNKRGRRGRKRGKERRRGGEREERGREEEEGRRNEKKMRDRETEAGVTKATTRGHHISSPFQSWHSLPSNPGTFPTSQAPVEILTTAHYDCVVYVMPSACHSLSTGSPRLYGQFWSTADSILCCNYYSRSSPSSPSTHTQMHPPPPHIHTHTQTHPPPPHIHILTIPVTIFSAVLFSCSISSSNC